MFEIDDETLLELENKFMDDDINKQVVVIHYSNHFKERVIQRVRNYSWEEFIRIAKIAAINKIKKSHMTDMTGEVSVLAGGKRYRVVYERNGKRDFALVTVKTPHKEYGMRNKYK